MSVGSNPWTKADPAKMVNLAQVCERYGAGEDTRVGAISFPPDQADKARQARRLWRSEPDEVVLSSKGRVGCTFCCGLR